MIKWSDIPNAVKIVIPTVAVIMSVVSYMTTFQTDAEAAEMEKRITKEVQSSRVDDIEAQIDLYEFQLLDEKLSESKKEWIKRKIADLKAKRECIREGTC